MARLVNLASAFHITAISRTRRVQCVRSHECPKYVYKMLEQVQLHEACIMEQTLQERTANGYKLQIANA